jgi:hypothetical protein
MKAILNLELQNIRLSVCLSVSLSDRYGVKPADAFSPVLFIFSVEYAAGKFRVNLEGLKLNDTHQLLLVVSAADVSLLTESLYVIKRERKKERKKKISEIFIFIGR